MCFQARPSLNPPTSATSGKAGGFPVGLTFPPVKARTRFLIQWMDDSRHVLGTTEVGPDLGQELRDHVAEKIGKISRPHTIVFTPPAGPTSTVQAPGGAYQKAIASIAGTAYSGVGLQKVEVLIKDEASGLYWNGSAWQGVSATAWSTASGTASWVYSSVPPWADGGSYLVWSRATDTSSFANVEAPKASQRLVFDITAPVSVVRVSMLAINAPMGQQTAI